MEKHVLILATTNDFLLKFEQDNVALLQAMGYTVHYAANLREPAYLSDRERIRARGVVPHHIDIALGDNRRALRQVLCLLRRWEMGAIHCHTPVGGLVGRLAGRLAPTRPVVVYTAHGFHFYRGAPLYNQLAFYPVEWNLARYTDILVTINSEDYRAARRLPLRRGGKVFQLPGVGLDRREFSPLPPAERAILRQRLGVAPEEFFLLSVGELNQNKNHQVVLEALSRLKRRGCLEGIRYGICGEGFARPQLEEEIRARGLSQVVTLYGYRPDIPQMVGCSPPAGRGWAWRGWNPWPWGCRCWPPTTGAPGSICPLGRTACSTPGTTRRALPGASPCCGGWTPAGGSCSPSGAWPRWRPLTGPAPRR